MRFCLIALLTLFAGAPLAEGQQKRVYIAPDDHTDYFWSADDVQYGQAFLDTIDYYLDLADTTQANAAPYQSRWNCDGSLWMWTYERNRTPAEFQRLIDRIEDGHVSVPLNALCVCLGSAPAEAVLRGMYYPGRIERQYGLRFRLAYLIENQTQPLGIASLWAGSGARYSWKGICGCDSLVSNPGDREHEIYRARGLDGAEVLIKWNSMFSGNESMGGYAEARSPSSVVDYVTVNAPFNGFATRYPYNVIGCFGKGWDDFQTQTNQFVATAQTMTNASRQVIVSNEQDFFEDFEQTYNVASLPAKAVSFGNEWELYSAGMADVTARAKRAVEKLRAAEAMAAIVSLFDPAFMNGRESARDRAFMNWGLFWEHDFGMVGPPTGPVGVQKRIAWQHQITGEIETYVATLHDDAAVALADLIPTEGANPRFFVFNPLNWTRDDIADLAYNGPAPVHVVDVATQIEVPSQLVAIDSQNYLRVLAEDVPSVGYRVYEIRLGAGQTFQNAATVTSGGAGSTTVTYEIAADNRDATSNTRNGPHTVRISGFDGANEPIDFVGDDSDNESAGVQFAINLPASASIQSAHLILRASPISNPSPTGGFAIQAYNVDNCLPFVDGQLIDLINHHPVLPATVLWPAQSWPGGSDVISPNLATLVQAFVSRPGYSPGNYLGLVMTEGTVEFNSYYGFDDYFAPGTSHARLEVTYTDPNAPPTGNSLVMENAHYQVTVDRRGAITSLIDKTRADREFAQTLGGRTMNDLGASTGTVTVEGAGPVSVTLKAVAGSPVAHASRITLYRGVDRIDMDNEITQNFGSVQNYGFGFNLTAPTVRHEEVGAILRARLATAGGDYSPRNARYDWLTMNHFADITGGDGVGLTLSNADAAFFKLGNSTSGTLDTTTPSITVLAGGNVANGNNGIPNQGGDAHFTNRFALRTHDTYDQTAAMKTAMEHQNPFVCRVLSSANAQLPSSQFSAVSISNPNILLSAFKPHDDGADAGLVIRLWNLSDSLQNSDIQLSPREIESAVQTTHIETDEAPIPVTAVGISAAFARQQIRTFRLIPAAPGPCGDFDSDDDVDSSDMAVFVSVLIGTDGNAMHGQIADVNQSGSADGADIRGFVDCMLGG